MAPFRLQCLGPPELRAPHGELIRIRTRKHLALLAFLAVEHATAHRRDRLATLLWPATDVRTARHSLAVALSVLRAKIGRHAFDSVHETIRLVPGHVVTDLSDLEIDIGDESTTAAGPFLESLDLPDAPEFMLWRDAQQVRLMPRVQALLARRIDVARRRGDTRAMAALATSLGRLDPLSEEAARAALESLALTGDRIGALRSFDRWAIRLSEELGAVPGPILQRMADRLRRGRWEGGAPGAVASVPTEQWKERTFLGRGDEFRTCYTLWEYVRRNGPRHVLVRGASGIGKTTLVERFSTAVALEGASVARVQCYQLERELPFGVIGALVGRLLDLPGAAATPPEHLTELARVVPKVRQRYPSLPTARETAGESTSFIFSEATVALITAIADEQPIVVAIDDIHLADATSLGVIHTLLRRVEFLPFMLLLTASDEPETEWPDALNLHGAPFAATLTTLILTPLGEQAATDLLQSLTTSRGDPGPTIRRAILRGAAGNPMLLELLVEDWRRRGHECLALSLSAMTSSAVAPARETFRRLVEGTLASLDAEARAVLSLAAILGKRLNDLGMYTLVDLAVARTMRAMTTLTAVRLLRDAGHQLEFANEVVRGECYVSIAGPVRRMLHGLVANRLLALASGAEPIPGLEIAWHLVRADRLKEAIPHLLAGSREAIRRGAPHETDLALSTGLPTLSGAARRTAILLRAEALQELSRWVESLRVLESSDEPFTESEDADREIMRLIGRRWITTGSPGGLLTAASRLLELARGDLAIETRARALAAMPLFLMLVPSESITAQLEGTLAAVESQPNGEYARLHLILVRTWLFLERRELAEAAACAGVGLAIIEREQVGSSVAIRLVIAAATALSRRSDHTQARALLERAMGMARRIDNAFGIAAAAVGLAQAHGALGDVAAQLESAELALATLPPGDWSQLAIEAAHARSTALAREHRSVEAIDAMVAEDRRFQRDIGDWAVQAWALAKADLLARVGESSRALVVARPVVSAPFDRPLIADSVERFAVWQEAVTLRDGS